MMAWIVPLLTKLSGKRTKSKHELVMMQLNKQFDVVPLHGKTSGTPNVTLKGCHAAMEKFALGMDIMNNLRVQKDEEARKNEEKARKVCGEYDMLLEKVQKLRDKKTFSPVDHK